jgi:hypothetical protein
MTGLAQSLALAPSPASRASTFAVVTEHFLAHLRRHPHPYAAKYADYPAPADINAGFCDQWAAHVVALVPGAWWRWLAPDHAAVVIDGRFYDAECHEGVESVGDLPLFSKRRMTPC